MKENDKNTAYTMIYLAKRQPNPNVVTAVFNFTNCNGSTIILDKDENNEYTKEVEWTSVENSIVMFNYPHPHYGITQR